MYVLLVCVVCVQMLVATTMVGIEKGFDDLLLR